ncbi:hypothetical protein SCLCIDRAFT_1213985, partial [Scleroderma citrinum Foug A]
MRSCTDRLSPLPKRVYGLTSGVTIATGALTHSQCAKGAQMRDVRVTFRLPDSRIELTGMRSSAYSM